jgi:hypothetical protein
MGSAASGHQLGKIWCKSADIKSLQVSTGWVNGRILGLYAELCKIKYRQAILSFDYIYPTAIIEV